jgi:2-amino-4-hydroxy-6-hydroxymethyldihydropteridine diphosphokinase
MAQVFIGMGSSINKLESISAGIASLKKEFGKLRVSTLYESEAVGFIGANFYNLVVELETDLTVEALISRLKAIEIAHGRAENAVKYAPRTLDLDLLLYDQQVDEQINLPRAEITENAFVLKPLAELAPSLKHPVLGETYQTLWANYPKEKQKLWKIEYHL